MLAAQFWNYPPKKIWNWVIDFFANSTEKNPTEDVNSRSCQLVFKTEEELSRFPICFENKVNE